MTVAKIVAAEESQKIHQEQGSYRRLYPTFAGLNGLELINGALYSIYPKLTSAVRRMQHLLKARRGIQEPSKAEDFDLLGAFLHVGRQQLEAIDPSHRLRRTFDQDGFDADRTRSKRLRREPPTATWLEGAKGVRDTLGQHNGQAFARWQAQQLFTAWKIVTDALIMAIW